MLHDPGGHWPPGSCYGKGGDEEIYRCTQSQHQHASGVGMPNRIAEDLTGMLLIVPCLGAAVGMGPSVNTGDAAPYVVGNLTGQRLGYTVDAAHGWG